MGGTQVRVRQRVRRPVRRSTMRRASHEGSSRRVARTVPTSHPSAAAYRLMTRRKPGLLGNRATMRLLRRAPEMTQRERDLANVIAFYSKIIRDTCARLNEEMDDYQDHVRALQYMQSAGGSVMASVRCIKALGYLSAAKKLIKELAPEPLKSTVDLVDVTKSLDYGAKVIGALSPVLQRYRMIDAMARADEADDIAARDLILEHKTPAKLQAAAKQIAATALGYWRWIVKTRRSLARLSREQAASR